MDILKHAVQSLSGANVRPLCSNHIPEVSFERVEGIDMVHIQCRTCNFSAWMAPSTYDSMIDEINDDAIQRIRAEGE